MTYVAKDYTKLIGMPGFSETLLRNHFTLYQGYVANINKVLDTLAQMLKDGESVVGTRAKVKIVKNKMAPPFREAQFDIIFGEGISREGDLVDIGFETGILDKAGTWYSYKGERLGQGRDNVKKLLKENKELAAQLEGEIRAKVGLTEAKATGDKPASK